jgi:hypothetical protein
LKKGGETSQRVEGIIKHGSYFLQKRREEAMEKGREVINSNICTGEKPDLRGNAQKNKRTRLSGPRLPEQKGEQDDPVQILAGAEKDNPPYVA